MHRNHGRAFLSVPPPPLISCTGGTALPEAQRYRQLRGEAAQKEGFIPAERLLGIPGTFLPITSRVD